MIFTLLTPYNIAMSSEWQTGKECWQFRWKKKPQIGCSEFTMHETNLGHLKVLSGFLLELRSRDGGWLYNQAEPESFNGAQDAHS